MLQQDQELKQELSSEMSVGYLDNGQHHFEDLRGIRIYFEIQ